MPGAIADGAGWTCCQQRLPLGTGMVPTVLLDPRLAHHPPAFRRLERQFPDLARMRALARQLLGLRDLGRGPL